MFNFLQINKQPQQTPITTTPQQTTSPVSPTSPKQENKLQQTTNLFQSLNLKSNTTTTATATTTTQNENDITDPLQQNSATDNDKRVIKKVKSSFKPGQSVNNSNNNSNNTNEDDNSNGINHDLSELYISNTKQEEHQSPTPQQQQQAEIKQQTDNEKNDKEETASPTSPTIIEEIKNVIQPKEEEDQKIETTNNIEISKLDKLIDELKNSEYRFYEKLSNIESSFQQSLEGKKKLNQLIFENLSRAKVLQEKENQLVENEEYEDASKVSEEIESLNRETENYEARLLNEIMKEKLKLESELSHEQLLIEYQQCSSDNQDQLLIIKSLEDENIEKYKFETRETIKVKQDEIETKTDLIARESRHLELDKEILVSNETTLKSTIDELNKPLLSQQHELLDKRQTLQDEINELLLRIQEKQDQQSQLDLEHQSIENTIQLSKGKFKKEESRLQQERANIDKRDDHIKELHCELQQLQLDIDSLNHPSDHPSFKTISKVDETISSCKQFLNETTNTLERIESQQQFNFNNLYNDLLSSNDSTRKNNNKLSTLSNSIQELTIQQTNLSNQKIQTKKQISELQDTIPLLEQSKNQAKDLKRFTEAASLLSELKLKQQLLIEKSKQLVDLSNEFDNDSTKLDQLQSEYNQCKSTISNQNSKIYSNLLENLESRQLQLSELIYNLQQQGDKSKQLQFYKIEYDSNEIELNLIKLKLQ